MDGYVDRVVAEILAASAWAKEHDLDLPAAADTIFLGGGTPSLLSPEQMGRIFEALRKAFSVLPGAEVTVEAAPGQLADELLDTMLAAGVDRVSLGVQSFVDAESRAVGRLHTAAQCVAEIDRLRRAGVPRLSLDLIAGLPLQTEQSWQRSLDAAVASKVEHISVYMLEVDEDSRLGREVESVRAASQLAVLGQAAARYGAATVPDDDRCAALYEMACAQLARAGLLQYEISNFARRSAESRHNLKYWKRAPYIGFGLDAHSMLLAADGAPVRFANANIMDGYLELDEPIALDAVAPLEAFEEAVFLGLRLVEGISFTTLRAGHGSDAVDRLAKNAVSMQNAGVLVQEGDRLSLTARGRAVSSSVFGELLAGRC